MPTGCGNDGCVVRWRFGFARTIWGNVCSIEFLGLCTVLLPTIVAGAGFFVGKTVSPLYLYATMAVLTSGAFCAGWRRAFSYLTLLGFCYLMTCYMFSYGGYDAQAYHFPMQYLLRNGWNPVFDSTIEKFAAVSGDARLAAYHTLFLPKFSSLCGAIVASAFGLFSGDGFLGYVLIVCLFSCSYKFAKRYWNSKGLWGVAFAASLTFSTKITTFLVGQVDYSTYASFCIAMLSLVLYIRENRMRDLLVFALASCVCMSSKTTGITAWLVLVSMTFPLLYRRIWYWRALAAIAIAVAVIGASPLLTAWVQYGSPFYPSTTFNPKVMAIDITADFTGNPDALSMGYLSRMCYAWVSPQLTVFALRLMRNSPSFSPVFDVPCGVAGIGLWFNVLLAMSVVLIAVSRKNLVTLLCVVIFVSSNLAPLKYIGYNRYFPQIWAIFPLATLNYVCAPKDSSGRSWRRPVRQIVVAVLAALLLSLSGLSLLRSLAFLGRMMVLERFRQNMIATFPREKPVRVSATDYRFSTVARFRQAGLNVVRTTDGFVDTIVQPDALLPCFDKQPEVYADLNHRFPVCNGIGGLVLKFSWLDVLDNLPHALFDKNKESSK